MIANAVKLLEDRADLFKFLLKAETGQPATIVDISAVRRRSVGAAVLRHGCRQVHLEGTSGTASTARRSCCVSRSASSVPWSRGTCRCSSPCKLGPPARRLHRRPAGGRNAPVRQMPWPTCSPKPDCPRVFSVVPGWTGHRARLDRQSGTRQIQPSPAVPRSARRSASWLAERLTACTLELGGKSAAIIPRTRISIRRCPCWRSPA